MLWTVLIVLVSALVGVVSTQYFGDDNEAEETMEKVIQLETGLDIDLSPNSPENRESKEQAIELVEMEKQKRQNPSQF